MPPKNRFFTFHLAFLPWISPGSPLLTGFAKFYYLWEYKSFGPFWHFCEHDLGAFWFTIIVAFIPGMLYIAALSYPGFYEAWTFRPFFQTPYHQFRLSFKSTAIDGIFPGVFRGFPKDIYFAKMSAPPAPPPNWEVYYFSLPDRLLMVSPPLERWIPTYTSDATVQSTPPFLRFGIRVDFDFAKVVYVPEDLSHFPLPPNAFRWIVAYLVKPEQPSQLLWELMRYGTSDAFRPPPSASSDGGEFFLPIEEFLSSIDWSDLHLPFLLFGLFVVERFLKIFRKKTRFFPFP